MTAEAQIYDQGYRRYDGPRGGLGGAMRSLMVHSMRDALGLGRSFRYKVFPFATIIAAYLPAAAFIGISALIPSDSDEFRDFLPSYAGYYNYVIAAIYLFAGFIAPELLCKDRRTGLLGVYLSSPLNRPTYLLGKALTVLGLLLLVTLGPPLLTLIAYSLESVGPDGFVEWMRTLFEIVVSSLVMGVLFAAVALAIASITDRAAVATATVLALFPGSAIVSDVLVDEADLPAVIRLFNLPNLPREIIFRIHGEIGIWNPYTDNPTWTLWAAWLGWIALSVAFIWFRYRKLLVRR